MLARLTRGYEILIVDDGSTDRTAEVATRLAVTISQVKVLHHPQNLGYGAALRTGFTAARCEWILLLDADGQFLPEEVKRLVVASHGADMALGYRERRADAAHRRGYAAAWRLLMRSLLRVRVRDIDCGFKLMRTSMVQSVALDATGAMISAELLAKARARGARMVEVPVTHAPRRFGRQTGGNPRVLLRAGYELVCLWWRIRRFPAAATASEASEAGRASQSRS